MYSIIQKIQPKAGGLFTHCALCILGGILLSLAFPSFNWFMLAWLAFIPLFYVVQGKSSRVAYFYGLLFGVAGLSVGFFWIGNLAKVYAGWSFPFYYLAVVLFAFYQAQVFALTLWLWIASKRFFQIPDLILLPSLWVLVNYFFPALFDFQLAASQTSFLWVLQPIEFSGAASLDWLIVFCNLLIFKILQQPKPFRLAHQAALVLPVFWLVLGGFLYSNWQKNINSWPEKKIGLVQPNRPATLYVPKLKAGYNPKYPPEMQWTEELQTQGAEFVVWPEGYVYRYTYQPAVKKSFEQHIQKIQIPLLFQDSTVIENNQQLQFQNSVIWLGENGKFKDIYHKRKLVPFGEYLPFANQLSKWLSWLPIPKGWLDAGTEAKVFDVAGVKVVPLICYETLFPELVAKSVGQYGAGKMLVNGSQNGWYDSIQQVRQHSASSTLRAVENRVPLLHVIYNGFSSYTLPNGQVFVKIPYKATGGFLIKVPYSKNSGGSFYSRYAGWFEYSLLGLLVFLAVISWRPKPNFKN